MESLVYMLSRTILTYTLFRGTRGVMQYGAATVGKMPDKLKLWECPSCDKLWSGESDEEDTCDYCGDYLIAKHYRPPEHEEEDEYRRSA